MLIFGFVLPEWTVPKTYFIILNLLVLQGCDIFALKKLHFTLQLKTITFTYPLSSL